MTNWKPPQLPTGKLTLAQAIARVEGYYATHDARGKPLTEPNRPQQNNNPGDLEFHAWMATKYGATLETGHTHNRFAVFASEAVGFAALDDLLKGHSYYPLTIEQAVNRFAPAVENDSIGYVAKVCKWTGCNAADTVGSVLT